jgi:hypothetical protein
MDAQLHRFQNGSTRKPLLQSAIFIRKMAPFTYLKKARELWNWFETPRLLHASGYGTHAAPRNHPTPGGLDLS